MKKIWIVVGVFLIVIGSVLLLYQSLSNGDDVQTTTIAEDFNPEDEQDVVGDNDIAFSRVFNGDVMVGNTRHDVTYRRLTQPIVIDEDFYWPRELSTSPLRTVLRHLAVSMNEATESQFYECYEDEGEMKSLIQKAIDDKMVTDFRDYIQRIKSTYVDSRVLGEITSDGITLVVVELAREPGREDSIIRAGIPVVHASGQYLIRPGAKADSDVLRKLSADKYSLLDQPDD